MRKADDRDADGEEPGFVLMALAIYKGRNGWVAIATTTSQLALVIGAVWCFWRFFQATDVLEALKWGLPAAVLAVIASVVKVITMIMVEADRIMAALRHRASR